MPEKPPSLQQQTIDLGRMFKSLADAAPSGTPSGKAGAAFQSWLAEAGPGSREPAYFEDVAANFDLTANSNKDVWELFDILENYIEVDDEDIEAPPARAFVSLPLIS